MEFKWLFIMMAVAAVAAAGVGSIKEYSSAQVKIACYEAAKTNQSIKCDKAG